jgi:2'-5' RNA ligase
MSINRQFLYPCSDEAQLSLGLGEEQPAERLFFATMPAPAAAERIATFGAELMAGEGLQGTLLPREQLYVTLHRLGEYAGLPPSLLIRARRAAARLQLPAFDTRFDRVGSFGGSRSNKACVLRGEDGVRGLLQLQRTLARRLAEQGIISDLRFSPKVTLLHSDRQVALRRIEPISWQVNEVVLVRSCLGAVAHDQIEGRWLLLSQ